MRLAFIWSWCLFCVFPGLHLFSQCSVPSATITGNTCVGSTLTASSNIPPSSIIWNLNGSTTVSSQTISLQPNGTTVAGSSSGISGSGANQFRNPDRIFVAADGTIYVPDLSNARVQKWAPGATSGITVAGGNGIGSAANQFNRPASVFLDQSGNMYVADQENGRVQKWAPGATSGVTVAGGLQYPTDVFVDANDNLYVSEQNSSTVKKWAPGSTVPIIVAGGNGYGSAANQLSTPTGIFVDAQGNIYICDTDNNRIQKWSAGAATGVTVAGGIAGGSGASELQNPLEIYVDCLGTMYIADYNNNRIQKWLWGASSGTTIAGGNGTGTNPNQLRGPIGVFMDANHTLYVSEFNNHRVQQFFSSSVSLTYTPLVPGDYTATIVYNGGSTVSNVITINPTKTLSVSIAASSLNICSGTAVQFTATPFNAGASPNFQWKKNGVPTGNNSDTYIDNNITSSDIITCTVSSSENCLSATSAVSNAVSVNVYNSPVVSLDQRNTLCAGDTRELDPGNFSSYVWNDGTTGRTLRVITPGTYYVTVTDHNGCKGSDTARITSLLAKPSGFLPRDSTVCKDTGMLLKPYNTYSSYLWNTGSTNAALSITASGVYWLEVTDANGCKGKAFANVTVKQSLSGFRIPNAFTPNNNRSNELFRPFLFGTVKKYDFRIYNRWGQLIFHTTDINKGWDGTFSGQIQTSGVYVWYCTYALDGNPTVSTKGTVALIR